MDKYLVSICDDDNIIHRIVKKYLSDKYKEQIMLRHYFDPIDIINEAKDQSIVLMDIDMPNMDGILAASKLRKNNKELIIIMLTSKRERFKDAFKVGASRFVTKPIDKEELYEAIDNALKDIDSDEKLTVNLSGGEKELKQDKIYLLEVVRNKVNIYLKDNCISVNEPLKNLEERLNSKKFVKVHKSYIVNMKYIKSISGRLIVLENGIKACISARREKEVLDKLFEYDLNYDR